MPVQDNTQQPKREVYQWDQPWYYGKWDDYRKVDRMYEGYIIAKEAKKAVEKKMCANNKKK